MSKPKRPTDKRIKSVLRKAKAELERLMSPNLLPKDYPVWVAVNRLLEDLEGSQK